MMMRMAFLSLVSRRLTVALTILALAVSVALFIGVEKIRTGAKESFADTISGTDLIVGARTGGVQLLLYSVFRVGNATNNITWDTYEDIAARDAIDWIVPMSLGDSHRGFRVLGTTIDFFDRYQFRNDQSVTFAKGQRFGDLFDVVLGADVAAQFGYDLGSDIVVVHGLASFVEHDTLPFQVSGVLEKTGTPVDRTLFVSLRAIEAIHVDWEDGAKSAQDTPSDILRQMPLNPGSITAALVGVKSKLQIFGLQRWINEYGEEPVMAIMPGIALGELWGAIGVAETALSGVSAMVVVTALIGMAAMFFAGLNARRREMAILRTLGARPLRIVGLLMIEAALMAMAAIVIGLILFYTAMLLLRSYLDAEFGLYLSLDWLTWGEVGVLILISLAALCVSLVPAIWAYKLTLADGMQV